MIKGKINSTTLEEFTDKYVGKRGIKERGQFEFGLKSDILGEMIRKTRKEQHLTQEQSGKLVGVQKALISIILFVQSARKDGMFINPFSYFKLFKENLILVAGLYLA